MATGPIEDRLPNNCLMLLKNGELRAGTGQKIHSSDLCLSNSVETVSAALGRTASKARAAFSTEKQIGKDLSPLRRINSNKQLV